MEQCKIRGCWNLQTSCVDCGRVVIVTNLSGELLHWVSVKDRMPKHLEPVLLLYKDKFLKTIITGHWHEINAEFVSSAVEFLPYGDYEQLYFKKKNITHWIPIPGMPKG